MTSTHDLALAAGLLEGEGTVRICTATANTLGSLEVSLVSTDREIVDWMNARWPTRTKITAADPATNRRQAFRWMTQARRAAAFLVEVEPFVITTRMKARIALALEFQAQKTWSSRERGDPEEYRGVQFGYYLRMRGLNVRGLSNVRAVA